MKIELIEAPQPISNFSFANPGEFLFRFLCILSVYFDCLSAVSVKEREKNMEEGEKLYINRKIQK